MARHGGHLGGTYRRPPTSCAHRLRKPDPTYELLALSVARWARGRGLLPAPPQHHLARAAVAAVGLGRQPPDEPERLLSGRLELCSPSGLGLACCSRALPRPAPCRSLRAWASLVKGRLVASSYPALSRDPPRRCRRGGPRSTTRKMRLTDFCNRLPSRAPCGSLDSRSYAVPRPVLRRFATRSTGSPWA
jgi:hypothetical protein